MAKSSHLFAPTIAFQYGQLPPPSEPRAHRAWRVDGGPSGAVITYRLTAPADSPRVAIVNAAGDTIARLRGAGNAGLNRVEWNLIASPGGVQIAFGGRGGGGGRFGGPGGPVNVAGFPPGYNPRPAESRADPDSSGSPTVQARALAQLGAGGAGRGGRGAGGGGGGGRGGGAPAPVSTGDYRVVLDVGGQRHTQTLRVVVVPPGMVSVMEK
jgi:hypothetical protein